MYFLEFILYPAVGSHCVRVGVSVSMQHRREQYMLGSCRPQVGLVSQLLLSIYVGRLLFWFFLSIVPDSVFFVLIQIFCLKNYV